MIWQIIPIEQSLCGLVGKSSIQIFCVDPFAKLLVSIENNVCSILQSVNVH